MSARVNTTVPGIHITLEGFGRNCFRICVQEKCLLIKPAETPIVHTLKYSVYLIGTGEFHAPKLRNEDMSGQRGDDHGCNDHVGHLDTVVVHLGWQSNDEDPVEYRR